MMFRVLGPVEVEVEGALVALPGAKPRALLTALLLQPCSVVSSDRLVDAIWGDSPPDAPGNALQQVVARLRARLGPLAELLRTVPGGGYTLSVPDGALDADLFEYQTREARARAGQDPRAAAALLDRALGLWRGQAYAELADGYAQPASVRLEELRNAALEDRAALRLATGEYAEAAAAARRLLAADPLRERPVEVLMTALYADGRTPEALAVFREHRQTLADELGLDPSPGLRALESQILRGDPLPPTVTAHAQPPTAVDAPAGEAALPWRADDLLGREEDLRLLRECLPERRLVTLVGPGGVGKTRLALELAHLMARDARPVWWADVTTVPSHLLLDRLAEVCGTEMPRGTDPLGALAEALRARPAGTLVVDNAESALGELAPVIERLAATVPGLWVLATSRERLAVAGEHVHVLAPLALPSGPDPENPAVRLFLTRAHGLEGEGPGEVDLTAVTELVRQLDGLPLAIELGAARASALGVGQLARLVGGELDLLAGGRRTAAARHRTLRAVVDASYAMLTPPEATLFARLSVFPGSFDLDQARTVCADAALSPAGVTTALMRLVEQSLLQAADGRFWLLETLRTYAGERLPQDERQRLRSAFARHVASRLRGLGWQHAPATEPQVVAAVGRMSPDLHLAWEHAVAHDRDLAVELAAGIYDFAYARQRRDLLEWGLVVAGWEVEHPLLPRALATAATAAWADGDLGGAAALAHRGLAAGRGPDDPATARSMVQAANLAMFAGQQEEAVQRFRAAGARYLAAGERIQALMTEMSVCQAWSYAGRADEAAATLPGLLARAEATGNPSAISWAHYVLGEASQEVDPEGAAAAFRAAAEHGRRSENWLFVMLARSALVALAARREPPGPALAEAEDVLAQWSDLRNQAAQWGVLAVVVSLLARVGELTEATVLAGAVRANLARQPLRERNEREIAQCLELAAERLGPGEADRLLATGAALPLDAVVARARQAVRDAHEAVRPRTPH
jgi:predicted ATPase/DNA-binding SARP family transcriptional activator